MTAYICSFSFTAIHQELHGFARNRAIISPSWNYFHTLRFSPLSRRAVSFSGNSHNTKVSRAQPQSFKRCPKLSIYLGTAPLAVLASFPHWQGLAAAALYACHGLWAVLLACYTNFVDKHVWIVTKYIFKILESKVFKTDLENWTEKTPGLDWFSLGGGRNSLLAPNAWQRKNPRCTSVLALHKAFKPVASFLLQVVPPRTMSLFCAEQKHQTLQPGSQDGPPGSLGPEIKL